MVSTGASSTSSGSVPGLLLGLRTVNTSAAGGTLLQQGAVAFLDATVPAGGHHLLAAIGTTSAASGSIRLPGSTLLPVRP